MKVSFYSSSLTPVKKNIKEKSERLNKAKDGVEKKPTQREKLNKQRTNAKEKGLNLLLSLLLMAV
jgi:hypothetical protein